MPQDLENFHNSFGKLFNNTFNISYKMDRGLG